MEEDVPNIEKVNKKSKPRCRMKKLLNKVQELLDFYFSDVNLNHDRFLRKEIENSPDGYVALSTMLKFNKLKQLTSDTAILAKAIDNSSSLQLSEDHQMVRRKVELLELEDTDSRTVYVEEFPIHTDHDWLKSVFSTCGTVEYISLPKFKHSSQVKGFAFIEFSTPEQAQNACQELNTIRCKNRKRLSTDGRSSEDESTKKKNRKRRSTSECDSQSTTNNRNVKRRRSISETSDGSPVKTRRRRSSLCSTEEVDEVINKSEKTVNFNTKCDVFVTSHKKRRNRDSVSSDVEHTSVKIKSEPTASPKSDDVLPDVPSAPMPTKTTIDRKRKSSDTKELENKAKTLKEKKCDKDIESFPKTSINSNENVTVSSENTSKTHALDVKSKISDSPDKDDCLGKADSHDVSSLVDKTGDSQETTDTNNKNEDTFPKDHKRKGSLTSDQPDITSPLKKVKHNEGIANNEVKKEEIDKVVDEEMDKKKKNRQHKKREKVSEPISIPPLHVIPKCEWSMLKKEYKRLQRIKMSELKRNLKVLKSEKIRRTELKERIMKTISAKNQNEGIEENMADADNKHDVDDEKENFLESKKSIKVESEEVDAVKTVDTKIKGLNMLPGSVVAMKTSSENLTRKDVKAALSGFGQVLYVDYVDGVYQGFIRFSSSDDVEKVITATPEDQQSWPFQLRKLSTDEENEYFRKAEEDRLKKYNKDQRKKRKKERGVDKITRDVETVTNHIHFT